MSDLPAPILESVVLPVRRGYEAAFERAFASAESLLARQHGYRAHSLRRGVEQPATYLLTVEWESVDDHEVGFRGSADYQEWRALLHPFYDPVPTVAHFGEDLACNGDRWHAEPVAPSEQSIADFWDRCRTALPDLPVAIPEAWAFGSTRTMADRLLELVLAEVKTGTASALWDYEAADEAIPAKDALSILLDGEGLPRALIRNTDVSVVPFDQVTAEHAASEGEGDRSLRHWREVHEHFFRTYADHSRGFADDMPVVCERFRLVWSDTAPRPS